MLQLDYTNVLAEVVGPIHGLTADEIDGLAAEIRAYHGELMADREAGQLRFYDLPTQPLDALLAEAKRQVESGVEAVVVLGIGGSALGNIALQTALRHPFWNALSKEGRGGYPKMYVLDNVDPDQFNGLLDTLPENTLYNAISKSGTTAETMSQFVTIWQMVKAKHGDKAKERFVVVTDPKAGYMRQIVDQEGITSFNVPEGVGGRFTVLTPVGLFSAAVCGIDVRALLAGAAEMAERCTTPELRENPAYLLAAIYFLLNTKHDKPMAVMMPYAAALKDLADWFRQLWAESLGKRKSLSGADVFVGQTPIKALGTTDQHSQVQLYAEGPFDKVFTFLRVEHFARDFAFPNPFPTVEAASYLAGHQMGELMNAEQAATEVALTDAGRPNLTITFPEVSPKSVGQFLMLYEVATVISGKLYGIDPLDQPGVEAGKKATYALLGRAGFEAEADRIRQIRDAKPKGFVI